MTADQFEREEFWKALGRLYSATENLRTACEELRKIAESHERRLDKVEVTHIAMQKDLRAAREAIERVERQLGHSGEAR